MAHEFRVPPIGFARRVLSLSMFLIVVLGVQIVGLLVLAVFMTVSGGLESAWFCWFVPAFLSFGLMANVAFFAYRARYYVTYAGVQGEELRLEALQDGSTVSYALPRQEVFARLERANGRGPKRLYLSIADARGTELVRQHMVGDWTEDRLVELLNLIRAQRGESIYEDEVRMLRSRW